MVTVFVTGINRLRFHLSAARIRRAGDGKIGRGVTINASTTFPELPMNLFLRLLVVPFLLALVTGPAMAADDTPRYNQIHFQVERSRPVENDRMQAVLSLTAEDDNAARLADQINRGMDAALKTAKARVKVEVRTGSYRTYPVYNKEKIQRWRATQELLLEGSDFAELGSLIGQLQERLQVASINFSVSSARRAAVEDELIAQALDAFKQRAELVRRQLAAKGYRIVDVSINTGGGQPVPIVMRAAAMEAASVTPPALEAGTSTMTVSVGGVVELQ
jgi:predicted secreted protein